MLYIINEFFKIINFYLIKLFFLFYSSIYSNEICYFSLIYLVNFIYFIYLSIHLFSLIFPFHFYMIQI